MASIFYVSSFIFLFIKKKKAKKLRAVQENYYNSYCHDFACEIYPPVVFKI